MSFRGLGLGAWGLGVWEFEGVLRFKSWFQLPLPDLGPLRQVQRKFMLAKKTVFRGSSGLGFRGAAIQDLVLVVTNTVVSMKLI